MKKIVVALALMLGLSAWTATSSARPGMGHERGMFDHLGYIADEIGLSEEQEQQINEIVDAAELASAVDRERMRQIRDELRDLAVSDDQSQAQILADELGEIAARIAYNRFETRAQVNAVFTEEQLASMEAIRADHEAMRESLSAGGFPGGFQSGFKRLPDGE